MKTLKIGDLLAKVPIVQGGMGVGISLSGLASAVANAGGVGVISTAGLGVIYNNISKDLNEASIHGLREELRKAREKSKGIIGVNIMVALTNFADMVKTSIEEKADIIFAGAGLPLNLPSFLKEGSTTKLAPIVSSARALKVICRRWIGEYGYVPDAVVVEGPKAGGHLGYSNEQLNDPAYALENIVPEVVEAAREIGEKNGKHIPVIAGGGIYTGEDIVKFMALGADGVQMGTRFVTTEEYSTDDVARFTFSCDENGSLEYKIKMKNGEEIELFGTVNSCSDEFIKEYGSMYGYAAHLTEKFRASNYIIEEKIIGVEHMEKHYADTEVWDEINSNEFNPLFNRAFGAEYPPGSTYKMCTLISAMENYSSAKQDLILKYGETIVDKGVFTEYDGFAPTCLAWTSGKYTHGEIDGSLALCYSCNYFFYELGDLMNEDMPVETAQQLGLGVPTGIELVEKTGKLNTKEQKRKVYGTGVNANFSAGDRILGAIFSAIVAIGIFVLGVNLSESVMPDNSVTSKTSQEESLLYKKVAEVTFLVIEEAKKIDEKKEQHIKENSQQSL